MNYVYLSLLKMTISFVYVNNFPFFYLGMKNEVKIILFYYINKTFNALEAYLKSILSKF